MIQLISKILEQTLQSDKVYDIDYADLAESIVNVILEYDSENEYYHLIDEIQILIMRKGYRFFTFIECEEIYNKILKVMGAHI
jgi:hypothetical protein